MDIEDITREDEMQSRDFVKNKSKLLLKSYVSSKYHTSSKEEGKIILSVIFKYIDVGLVVMKEPDKLPKLVPIIANVSRSCIRKLKVKGSISSNYINENGSLNHDFAVKYIIDAIEDLLTSEVMLRTKHQVSRLKDVELL